MPTTYFPNCPCCGPASGSGRSGSGSGSGRRRVPHTPICQLREVPTTLYVTYGGMMAPWGTVPYVFTGFSVDTYEWYANNDLSAPNLPNLCGIITPLSYLRFCGLYGASQQLNDRFILSWGGAGGGCTLTPGTPSGVIDVLSWDPFYAEGGGTPNLTCTCTDPYSFIVTEMPP